MGTRTVVINSKTEISNCWSFRKCIRFVIITHLTKINHIGLSKCSKTRNSQSSETNQGFWEVFFQHLIGKKILIIADSTVFEIYKHWHFLSEQKYLILEHSSYVENFSLYIVNLSQLERHLVKRIPLPGWTVYVLHPTNRLDRDPDSDLHENRNNLILVTHSTCPPSFVRICP